MVEWFRGMGLNTSGYVEQREGRVFPCAAKLSKHDIVCMKLYTVAQSSLSTLAAECVCVLQSGSSSHGSAAWTPGKSPEGRTHAYKMISLVCTRCI